MASPPAILVLVLEPDNPCNTRLSDRDTGEVLYTVRTEHGDKTTTTKVADIDDVQIAQWVWRDVRSDVLTLGTAPPVPSSVWLKKSMVPFKDTVRFTDFKGGNYKWKGNGPGLSLELYSEKDKKAPIARFKKSYRYKDTKTSPPTDVNDPATLTVTAVGQEILDMIVISFCLLEKARRIRENGIGSMAASLAIPPTQTPVRQ